MTPTEYGSRCVGEQGIGHITREGWCGPGVDRASSG
jgi:hypothetical protein